MKRYIVILLIAISGLTSATGQNFNKNISISEADQLIRDTTGSIDLVILDVRTPEEFSKEHIKGAINIDFWGKGFMDAMATHNINRTYLIYCTSGVRSNGAMNKMRKLGFTKLYNMKGGLFGWKAAKMPVVTGDAEK